MPLAYPRYKHEIREEDKDGIRKLVGVQHHHLVSPEVLRELNSGRSRGQKPAAEAQSHVASLVREDPAHLAQLILMED